MSLEVARAIPTLYLTRCCQIHRQSPLLPSFTSPPEVRALSSAGVTRPHRSYSPLRLPDWPPPCPTTFGAATPSQSRASLTDLRSPSPHAVLTTPVDRNRCSLVGELRVPAPGFFPVRVAFPVSLAGRRPHLYFRGLLKLHTRYGLQSCSLTIRKLYREAPP